MSIVFYIMDAAVLESERGVGWLTCADALRCVICIKKQDFAVRVVSYGFF